MTSRVRGKVSKCSCHGKKTVAWFEPNSGYGEQRTEEAVGRPGSHHAQSDEAPPSGPHWTAERTPVAGLMVSLGLKEVWE